MLPFELQTLSLVRGHYLVIESCHYCGEPMAKREHQLTKRVKSLYRESERNKDQVYTKPWPLPKLLKTLTQ